MAAPTTTGRRTVRPTSRIAAPGISRIAGMAPATGRTVRPDLTADRMAPAPDRITVRGTSRLISLRTDLRIIRPIRVDSV